MAILRGSSGALQAALAIAHEAQLGVDANSLDEFRRAAAEARRLAGRSVADATRDVERETADRESRLRAVADQVRDDLADANDRHERDVAQLSDGKVDLILTAIALATCAPLVVVPLVHWASRSSRRSRLVAEHRCTCEATRRRYSDEERRLDLMSRNPGAAARERIACARERYRTLKSVLDTPEARGAAREVEVIERLSRLSDDYIVLNDLKLRAPHFMRFDGSVVRSAQVDHVVIGPSGIFVIETKAWSAAFAESGQGFDPCEQVCRAGLLCHVLLKEAGLPFRVRNVIARRGHLPDSPHMRHVTMRAPEQLPHTIQAGRTRLDDDEVHAVGQHLWHTYGDLAA